MRGYFSYWLPGLLILLLGSPVFAQSGEGFSLFDASIDSIACGDGIVGISEQCDLGIRNGVACLPIYGGQCTLCTTACTPLVVQGPSCGDHAKNGVEQCDGTDLGGSTCGSLGFVGGTLSCYAPTAGNNACRYDTSACTSPLSIVSITPEQVSPFIGNTFTLTGTGFQGGDDVQFTGDTGVSLLVQNPPVNGNAISFSLSSVQLGLLTPGTVRLRVVREHDYSNIQSFSIIEPLSLDAIEPGVIGIEWPQPFTLTGTGFDETTRVIIGGHAVEAFDLYVADAHTLIVYPSVSLVQELGIGRHAVQVENNTETAGSEELTVGPLLASAGPSGVLLDGTDTPLTLYGSDLLTSDRVRFAGERGTIEKYPEGMIGSGLGAILTSAEKNELGEGDVELRIVRAGHFESNGIPFSISNPSSPRAESVFPSSLAYNAGQIVLRVDGKNMLAGAHVSLEEGWVEVPASFVAPDGSYLLASLTPADTVTLGTGNHWLRVKVGAIQSNPLLLSIQDPLPIVSGVSPPQKHVSLLNPPALSFSISGNAFQSYSRVRVSNAHVEFTIPSTRLTRESDMSLSGSLTSAEQMQLGYGPHALHVINGTQESPQAATLTLEPAVPACGDGFVSPGETCDPPGSSVACTSEEGPGYHYCSDTCTGFSACYPALALLASAGDSLVLHAITSPTTFRADQDRIMTFDIRDFRAAGSSIELVLAIEDSGGQTLQQNTVTFVLPPGGMVSINLDPSHALAPGKTYTVRARLTPPTGETIIGNNAGVVSFTLLDNATDVSIPDSPAWVGVMMMLGIGAWLTAASRKRN